MTTRPALRSYQAPIERLGGDAELDDEIVAEVLRLSLAALFPPQPDERRFVRAHDDPGVRAAKKMAAGTVTSCGRMWIHDFLRNELYAYVCSADREPSRQRVVV